MKKRIQYLYENGNPSYLELFLTSESMADFLNKSSYAEQVTAYDRSMLEEYIAQKQAVKEKEKTAGNREGRSGRHGGRGFRAEENRGRPD